MLNQIVLVGRLTEIEKRDGKALIVLAVPRSFKNEEGEFETDYIECITFGNVADNVTEYCKKGDLVGIKGRIEVNNKGMKIIAEKVTFLSSSKKEEQ